MNDPLAALRAAIERAMLAHGEASWFAATLPESETAQAARKLRDRAKERVYEELASVEARARETEDGAFLTVERIDHADGEEPMAVLGGVAGFNDRRVEARVPMVCMGGPPTRGLRYRLVPVLDGFAWVVGTDATAGGGPGGEG